MTVFRATTTFSDNSGIKYYVEAVDIAEAASVTLGVIEENELITADILQMTIEKVSSYPVLRPPVPA